MFSALDILEEFEEAARLGRDSDALASLTIEERARHYHEKRREYAYQEYQRQARRARGGIVTRCACGARIEQREGVARPIHFGKCNR